MQITIESTLLLENLNTVIRAIAARPAINILEGVLIVANENEIKLICTDGSMTIEASTPCTVSETGSVVLAGKLLTEMIRRMNGGTVTISTNDKNGATVKCKSFRSNIAGMNPIDFPEIPSVHPVTSISISQKKLKEMISHVAFSIATDESRKILTGCLMEITVNEVRMVALDGFRLAIQKVNGEFNIDQDQNMVRYVIPGKVISELGKILDDSDDLCDIVFDKARMEVKIAGKRFIAQQLIGDYIDYRRILPTQFSTTVRLRRQELSDAIDRASLMANIGKNNLIRMSFSENEVIVSSNAELGDVHESVSADIQGNPLNIAFNSKYVIDVIRNISDEELNLNFNSNVSPCIISPLEGDQYVYLILPVRVFQ